MALELREDSFGDTQNALFLATASNLAYEPAEVGGPAFREQLGLEATLYTAGNTEAYVGTNAEHIVVAFRGTESPATLDGLKDMLLNDARNLLIVPTPSPGWHAFAAPHGPLGKKEMFPIVIGARRRSRSRAVACPQCCAAVAHNREPNIPFGRR